MDGGATTTLAVAIAAATQQGATGECGMASCQGGAFIAGRGNSATHSKRTTRCRNQGATTTRCDVGDAGHMATTDLNTASCCLCDNTRCRAAELLAVATVQRDVAANAVTATRVTRSNVHTAAVATVHATASLDGHVTTAGSAVQA